MALRWAWGADFRLIDNDLTERIDTRFQSRSEGVYFAWNGYRLNLSYSAWDEHNDVVLTRPARFDFNAVPVTTEATYDPLNTQGTTNFGQPKTTANVAGWTPSAVQARSVGGNVLVGPYTPVDLLRDLHFTNTTANFYVDAVANQEYQALVTSGDYGFQHDASQFTVSGGAGGTPTATAATAQQEFAQLLLAPAGVADLGAGRGVLQTTMKYVSTQNQWGAVINGLDLRPVNAVGRFLITRDLGPDLLPADGLTRDHYTGSGAPPDTLITLSLDRGSLTGNDVDAYLQGVQLRTDSRGAFGFWLQRPGGSGDASGWITVNFSGWELDGRSTGAATYRYVELPAPANLAPLVTASQAQVTASEGSTAVTTGTFVDPDSGDLVTLTASVGKVTYSAGTSGTWNWSWLTSDGPVESQKVTLTASDTHGGVTTTTFNLLVTDVAPTLALSGADTVPEAALYTLTLGAVNDPGRDTVQQYLIHWGDNLTTTITAAALPANRQLTHIYADGPTVPTITVDVVDEDGTHLAVAASAVRVSNVVPQMTVSGAARVNEGAPYTLTLGTVTDPGTDTVQQYVIHWGDQWTTIIPAAVLPANRQVLHTYADGSATPLISVDLIDEDGTFAAVATSFATVDNVTPTMSVSGASTVAEGSPYALTLGAVTDPGTDTIGQYVIHWGDNQTSTVLAANLPANRQVLHAYANGPLTAALTVDLVDEDGTYLNVASRTVSVTDVAPSFDPGPGALTRPSFAFQRTLSFTDPGADVWSGTVNWADGVTQALVINQSAKSFALSHTYAADGIYLVSLTVSDGDAGGSLTQTFRITVSSQVDYTVVGADAGYQPRVQVFDTITKQLKYDFLAYEATYRGGVRVATGVVNGDGTPDIVTVPGRSRAPDIKVFDGKTGLLLTQILAASTYGRTFVDGLNVAVGDVTGDGKADIVTVPTYRTSTVKVFQNGGTGLTWTNPLSFNAFADYSAFLGGASVAVGDLDGLLDGNSRADIIVASGSGMAGLVRVFQVNGSGSAYTTSQIRQITDPDPTFRGGLSVAVGNVNGDATLDIITGALALGNSWVRVYDGGGTGSVPLNAFQAFSEAGSNPQAAVRVLARDIDGDGRAEILAAQGPDGTAAGSVANSKPIRRFKPLDGSQIDDFFATSPDFAGGLFLG